MSSSPVDPETNWVDAIIKRLDELRALHVSIPPYQVGQPLEEYCLKLTLLLAEEGTARFKPDPSPLVHSPPSAFRRRLKKTFYNAIAEGVNTFFFILLLAGARWLVEHLFGESKFFDYVPMRYLFDLGDIAVIGRFIWNTIKGEE